MTSGAKIDSGQALAFLKWLNNSPQCFYSDDPETGDWKSHFVTQKTVESLLQSLRTHNLYTSPAQICERGWHGKPSKLDITDTQVVWVDIDPCEALPTLADIESLVMGDCEDGSERAGVIHGVYAGIPRPGCVVYSGRGIQVYWKLVDRLKLPEHTTAVEGALRYLANKLHGDEKCAEISHVLRMPGTINHGSRKKGPLDIATVAIYFDDAPAVKLQDFGSVAPSQTQRISNVAYEIDEVTDVYTPIQDLRAWCARWKITPDHNEAKANYYILVGDVHARLDAGPVPEEFQYSAEHGTRTNEQLYTAAVGPITRTDNTSSATVFAVVNACLRKEVPENEILALLMSTKTGFAGHLHSEHDPLYKARRQIAKITAKFKAAAPLSITVRQGERVRSPEQVSAAQRGVARFVTKDIEHLLARCLREWTWRADQLSEVLPFDVVAKAYGDEMALVDILDKDVRGPNELALREVITQAEYPVVTQLRYIVGKGYDYAPTGAALKQALETLVVGDNGQKGKNKNPHLWLTEYEGSVYSTDQLATHLKKRFQYTDPESLLNGMSTIMPGNRDFAELSMLFRAKAVPQWTRWIKNIDPEGKRRYLNEPEAHLALCAIEANDIIRYDAFRSEMVWVKSSTSWDAKEGDPVIDKDEVTWLDTFLKTTGLPVKITVMVSALKAFTREFSFDSPGAWLRQLPEWDGVSRWEQLLGLMHTCTDDLHQRMMRWWTCQLVMRMKTPGAKADYLLMLCGEQGTRKTTLFEHFGMGCWTLTLKMAELRSTNNGDKLSRKLQGNLIVNIDEWGAQRKEDREVVKSFITMLKDDFDVKYQRTVEKKGRRFIFGATSNIMEILSDPTGDRRYFPMILRAPISSQDLATIDEIWPLLIAESKAYIESGADYWPNKDEEAEIRALQEGNREGSQDNFRETSDLVQEVHSNLTRMHSVGITAFSSWEAYTGKLKPAEGSKAEETWRTYTDNDAAGKKVREAVISWRGHDGETVLHSTRQVRRGGIRVRNFVMRSAANRTDHHRTLDKTSITRDDGFDNEHDHGAN